MSVSLYTPTGARMKRREVVEMPWGVMQRFIDFSQAVALRYGLGIHCAACKQDLVGNNSEHDPVLKMTCGCREFWSTNPGVPRA